MFLKAFCVVMLVALVAGNGVNPGNQNLNPGGPQPQSQGHQADGIISSFSHFITDGERAVGEGVGEGMKTLRGLVNQGAQIPAQVFGQFENGVHAAEDFGKKLQGSWS